MTYETSPFCVCSLASGSSGNCTYVACGGTELLIDAGLSMRATEKALNRLGSSLSRIAAIFVTHEHIDHVKGIPMIEKHYAIPVYAATPTAWALERDVPPPLLCPQSLPFEILCGDVRIAAFVTSHDSRASCGYTLTCGAHKIGIATDMGEILMGVKEALTGCEAVLLESNYDAGQLRTGPYPFYLKERIAGAGGHLENQSAARFAAYLVLHGTRRLLLAHLSEENNTPETALNATRQALALACPGHRVWVDVARRHDISFLTPAPGAGEETPLFETAPVPVSVSKASEEDAVC